MQRKDIAVILTGVPNINERCIDSLEFLLDGRDADFFAVFREEFSTPERIASLKSRFPGIKIILVPQEETTSALNSFKEVKVAGTVVMMWHEIWYASKILPELNHYQLVMRTRFDIYFHRQYLPDIKAAAGVLWLPAALSWSGLNDMICVCGAPEFIEYADTYERMHKILVEGIGIPELILARSVAMASLNVNELCVFFLLYREPIFSSLSDKCLSLLAHLKPDLSTYKIGSPKDTPELRQRCLENILTLTKRDEPFPIFETRNGGANFYPVEIDQRDGRYFRWMGMHACVNIAREPKARKIKFLLHFHAKLWTLDQMIVLVDGESIKLEISSIDALGRKWISGSLVGNIRRPWSKISFGSKIYVIPSEEGSNVNDHRILSVAIGSLEFVAD